MAIETPLYDSDYVRTYKFTALAAAGKTDLIRCRGARSVYLIASTGDSVNIMLPAVPASGNPDNTAGVRLASLIGTTTNNGVVDPAVAPNGSRAGVVPGDMMPPIFYLENVSGAPVDIDVWVTY
jgi:hypothetical protein